MKVSLLTSAPTRFTGSLHLLSHTHWDHELVRPRSRRPPRPRKRPDRVGCRGRGRGGGRVARFMGRKEPHLRVGLFAVAEGPSNGSQKTPSDCAEGASWIEIRSEFVDEIESCRDGVATVSNAGDASTVRFVTAHAVIPADFSAADNI